MSNNWEVVIDLVVDWLRELDQKSYEQVVAAMELLSERGPNLGRPLVDSVAGSQFKNMKELRPGSAGRSELRVLFAFDRSRRAVMLVAGDKAGNWRKWYEANIPVADSRFDEHLSNSEGSAGNGDQPK